MPCAGAVARKWWALPHRAARVPGVLLACLRVALVLTACSLRPASLVLQSVGARASLSHVSGKQTELHIMRGKPEVVMGTQ